MSVLVFISEGQLIADNINFRATTGSTVSPQPRAKYSSGFLPKTSSFCFETLFVSAFFSLDKDFHPVFIDYCLMSHPDNTVQAIHFPPHTVGPLLHGMCVCVCVFVNFCLLPVNDVSAIHSMCVCVFVCECAVCLCASPCKQRASTLKCKSLQYKPSLLQ